MDGKVGYKIIRSCDLVRARRALHEQYAETVKKWRLAVAKRRSEQDDSTTVITRQPMPPQLTVVASRLNQKDAVALATKLAAQCAVVRVTQLDGTVKLLIVPMTELVNMSTKCNDAYKVAMHVWRRKKDESVKSNPGEQFTEPRPKQPSFSIVAKGVKDKAAAEAIVARLEKKK
jgi:hypothetical protein